MNQIKVARVVFTHSLLILKRLTLAILAIFAIALTPLFIPLVVILLLIEGIAELTLWIFTGRTWKGPVSREIDNI